MVELSLLVWIFALLFGYIGSTRGWTKEVISTAGIVLALFALHEFDTLIRQQLLVALSPDQVAYAQMILFLLIIFFAYQTRAIVGAEAERERSGRRGRDEGRDSLQTRALGALMGLINGYAVAGSLWYFIDINRLPNGQYPLAPYIIAPPDGSASQDALSTLPLYVLAQGPGGNSELLALAVILLFILVLILI